MQNKRVRHRIYVRRLPSCTRWAFIGSFSTNFVQHIHQKKWKISYSKVPHDIHGYFFLTFIWGVTHIFSEEDEGILEVFGRQVNYGLEHGLYRGRQDVVHEFLALLIIFRLLSWKKILTGIYILFCFLKLFSVIFHFCLMKGMQPLVSFHIQSIP